MFEQRTKEYPDDTFRMREFPGGLEAYNFNKKTTEEVVADFSDENIDKLMKFTNEQIVNKFKKILKISSEKGEIYKETKDFIERLETKKIDDIEDNIWDIVVDAAERNAVIAKDRDDFLRKIDIIF